MIITLTSDWGSKDHYVAAVKAKILSYNQNIKIIDISHSVPYFDIIRAAYIVKQSFADFPNESVHLICVDDEASIKTPHIAVKYNNHYFITADNGILSLIFEHKPEKVVEINIPQDSNFFTFPAKDLFAKAACSLIEGKTLDDIGTETEIKNSFLKTEPVRTGNIIKGMVIYIDNFQNIITNIDYNYFKENVKNNKFSIVLPPKHKINKISTAYNDVPRTNTVAFFNTSNLLEIAVNGGTLASLYNVKIDDIIRVEIN